MGQVREREGTREAEVQHSGKGEGLEVRSDRRLGLRGTSGPWQRREFRMLFKVC